VREGWENGEFRRNFGPEKVRNLKKPPSVKEKGTKKDKPY